MKQRDAKKLQKMVKTIDMLSAEVDLLSDSLVTFEKQLNKFKAVFDARVQFDRQVIDFVESKKVQDLVRIELDKWQPVRMKK